MRPAARRGLAFLLPFVAFGVLPTVIGIEAQASCVPSPGVSAAIDVTDLVFVGTAVSTTNRGRWATFAVEDIWRGAPGEGPLMVRGGPADAGGGVSSATSVDRNYTRGVRYLVFASDPAAAGAPPQWGGRWEDNACSETQPYRDELGRFRPATAHRVDQPASPDDKLRERAPGGYEWISAAAALVVATFGAAAWLRRRRTSSTSRRGA